MASGVNYDLIFGGSLVIVMNKSHAPGAHRGHFINLPCFLPRFTSDFS